MQCEQAQNQKKQGPDGRFLDSCQLTFLANSIAVALADGMTIEEQNIWGNLLSLVGSSLSSIAAINATNQELAEIIAAKIKGTGPQTPADNQTVR